jgi:hypothetical protein
MRTIFLFACISILVSAQEMPSPLTPCELVAGRREYDRKIVRVFGYVEASYHMTLLTSPDCRAAITLADSISLPKESLYSVYSDGVQAMRAKNEHRKFRVVVEGRFNAALRRHGVVGSQLVITRIMDARFEGGQ